MEALTGLLAVGAALLVLGGAPKIVHPNDTARALSRLGLPSARPLVRVGGAAEVVVGLAVLAVGGAVVAALVALSYAGFTAVVAVALRRGGPLASCGCFGRPDTPPTRAHLVVTAGLALAAVLAAAAPPSSLLTAVLDSPGTGVALLLAVGVATALAYVVLAVLPLLSAPVPSVRTLPLVPAPARETA